MGEDAVVVVLIPAAVQAHQHAEPDLLSGLDCADPHAPLEVLQVRLHSLLKHLVRRVLRVEIPASPLRPGAIGELPQVESAQLVSDAFGHGVAIVLGQQAGSQLFGLGLQIGMGLQERAQDGGLLDR
jgi:hypothetical protein